MSACSRRRPLARRAAHPPPLPPAQLLLPLDRPAPPAPPLRQVLFRLSQFSFTLCLPEPSSASFALHLAPQPHQALLFLLDSDTLWIIGHPCRYHCMSIDRCVCTARDDGVASHSATVMRSALQACHSAAPATSAASSRTCWRVSTHETAAESAAASCSRSFEGASSNLVTAAPHEEGTKEKMDVRPPGQMHVCVAAVLKTCILGSADHSTLSSQKQHQVLTRQTHTGLTRWKESHCEQMSSMNLDKCLHLLNLSPTLLPSCSKSCDTYSI